jgi:hypothetical protein
MGKKKSTSILTHILVQKSQHLVIVNIINGKETHQDGENPGHPNTPEEDLAEDEDHHDANDEDADDSAGAFESWLYGPSV